ncbi:exodeoxyribonuclease III [Thermithiobacillus plumbiphilus]|uniref:Exodeoxyribonuclease III n=1 Tax=Thermithiobacillus plumbiphilus TaxID=1729899 RepID=A0ABU9DCL9_9PROT
MKLYSWNINGLRGTAKKGLLEWMQATPLDLLCLQETKCAPTDLPDEILHPPGFKSCFATAEKKGYSGVATYCRQPPLACDTGLGIERFDREGRVLVSDHGDFLLYNVYFPNGKASPERLAYKLDFYAAFLDHINARVKEKPIIFCGDVNTAHRAVDLARPRENEKISGFLPEERAWLDRWTAHGWVDSFRHCNPEARDAYSWWSLRSGARERNVGWRIDYFFVHQSLLPRVKAAGISPEVMGADHCPVWLELHD